MDYDDAALRALLESDFRRLTRGVTKAPQIDAVVGCLFTAMKRIMHGLTSDWNRRESTYRLPDELLAACFALLPFRDRVTASHVSHAWRSAALASPKVWSRIDLSSNWRMPHAAFEEAVLRAGQLPVDLDYSGNQNRSDNREEISRLLEMCMHRLRHFTYRGMSIFGWNPHDARLLPVRGPAPLLESVITDVNVQITEDFLAGQAGRLRILRVPVLDFPHTCPALRTVTDLRGNVPATTEGDGDPMRRVFHLVPNLRSLVLRNVTNSFIRSMEHVSAPASLVQLRLECGARCDLAALYVAWRTYALAATVLCFIRPPEICDALSLLLSEAVSVEIDPTYLIMWDNAGRKCRLTLEHPGLVGASSFSSFGNPSAFPAFGKPNSLTGFGQPSAFRQPAAFGSPASRQSSGFGSLLLLAPLSCLKTLRISRDTIQHVIENLPRHLVRLELQFIRPAPPPWTAGPFTSAPPPLSGAYDFGSLDLLPGHFTSLDSLRLEMVPGSGANGRPSLDDARSLLAKLSALRLSSLAVQEVCVHGFPEEVIREIDADPCWESLHDADCQTRIVFL